MNWASSSIVKFAPSLIVTLSPKINETLSAEIVWSVVIVLVFSKVLHNYYKEANIQEGFNEFLSKVIKRLD